MRERKNERRAAIITIIVWLALCGALILAAGTQVAGHQNRTTKAPAYDRNCITQPTANPIKECKR